MKVLLDPKFRKELMEIKKIDKTNSMGDSDLRIAEIDKVVEKAMRANPEAFSDNAITYFIKKQNKLAV